jgi:hypothetical protein
MKELAVKRVSVYQLRIFIMEKKMKTKYFFNAVMAVLIAVIFSVLMGCASAGTETGDAVEEDPAAAEQLAADINALEAGKAVLSGATVTLTGEVRLTTSLTVPTGVTLDLTREALKLGENAILTVYGTVNAKAGGINVDSGTANPTTINGNGTIYLKSKGKLIGMWVQGRNKSLILDGVTLVGLADNNGGLVQVEGDCELVMKSGTITGNTSISDDWGDGAGVKVVMNGTFIMEGGTISGNATKGSNAGGGGVSVWDEAIFTMKGGTISDNSTAQGNGGGVLVGGGTFTMEDGTISGNSSSGGGGGVGVRGGDIHFGRRHNLRRFG